MARKAETNCGRYADKLGRPLREGKRASKTSLFSVSVITNVLSYEGSGGS